MLKPFIEAEREFVHLQSNGEHEAAVRALENVLRAEQRAVQQMRDTMLSTLFERLAVGYNTLGMKYLKDGNTDVSLKFFEKAEALTDPANLHMTPESRLVLQEHDQAPHRVAVPEEGAADRREVKGPVPEPCGDAAEPLRPALPDGEAPRGPHPRPEGAAALAKRGADGFRHPGGVADLRRLLQHGRGVRAHAEVDRGDLVLPTGARELPLRAGGGTPALGPDPELLAAAPAATSEQE